MKSQEVELIDYLRVLWRQKWVILLTFVAAVAAAYSVSRAIAPTYQTRTSLLLLPPLSSQLEAEAVGSRLAPEAYQELAVSTSILQMVAERVDSLGSTKLAALRGRFSVTVKRLSGAGELLLTATVRGTNPDQLPVIAEAWTAAFAETYGEFFQDRIARSYSYVSENYAKTETELSLLISERTTLLLEHPIDLLQAELASLLESMILNQQLLDTVRLERDIAAVRLAALVDELELQPLAHVLHSSIPLDSLIAAAASGLATRDIETLAGIRTESEELNTTYENLNAQISSERATLRALEEEIALREREALRLRRAVGDKQTEVTDVGAKLENSNRQIGLLTAAHGKLAASLQDAKIALAETPEPIRVIDEALVPLSPLASKTATNIAVAGFLGLIVGTLFAFLTDYLTRARQEERREGLAPSSLDQLGREQTDQEPEPGGEEDWEVSEKS